MAALQEQGEAASPADVELSGIDGFIAGVSRYARASLARPRGDDWFVQRIGEAYAYIHLQDVWNPSRFLRQMAGSPPVAFGTGGFRRSLVDDSNPARHYTAFVFLGYWLPRPLAILSLWLWEIAGFVRYGGVWSWNDIYNGYVGLRHGRLVRRYGALILPGLIAAELAEPPTPQDRRH